MSNPADSSAASAEAAPAAGVPLSAGTQEVRFATAMTGGVSLAIWMGGVARELNLLDQASRAREKSTAEGFSSEDADIRGLYQSLLDLLDVKVCIDVLSGTSAGGINAALLGVCSARGVDLGPLRTIWLETGAFDTLLRDPRLKDPPSLLQGDGVLLDGLTRGLTTLTRQTSYGGPSDPPKVFVTTTLLTAETSRFTDDYGTLVPDVDHSGLFTFDGEDFTQNLPAIALAARASASFPGAFEPAFIPYGDKAIGTEGPPDRPAMAEFANTTKAHWVADGGILANRPIGQLLQAVFDTPANGRQVRRVLLYVVPDPGGTPNPVEVVPEEAIGRPLLLGEALRKDFAAALNHSISADLNAIRQHNDRVQGRADARLRLAELASSFCENHLVTDAGWAGYTTRESERLAAPVVQRIMRCITTIHVPKGWMAELAPGKRPEEECRQAAAVAVASQWQRPASGDYAGYAKLGRSAFEGARVTVLGVLRMAYPLAEHPGDRAMLADLSQQAHLAFEAADTGDFDHDIFAAVFTAAHDDVASTLVNFAIALVADHVTKLAAGTCASPFAPAAIPAGLAQAWWALADLVVEATPKLKALIDPYGPASSAGAAPAGSAAARRADAAEHLAIYLAYLGTNRDQIAARLLDLYVAQGSMQPIDVDVDQPVELIQVSANTRTLLDLDRSNATAKLTGVQLHHFGAFYKPSWRANDWMWGRLDGAGWLVHVLLDPRRIDALHRDKGKEGFKKLLADIVGPVPDMSLGRRQDGSDIRLADAVDQELAFLDDLTEPIPVSVPSTAIWVARPLQQLIAARELVVVANQMLSRPGRHDGSWPLDVLKAAGAAETAVAASQAAMASVGAGRSARPAAGQVKSAALSQQQGGPIVGDPAKVALLLPSDPVPTETFQGELGSPLMTRTVVKAVAVLAGVLPAATAKPPATLKPLFATSRTVTLTGYRAIDVTGTAPRRLILAGAGLGALGFVLASRHSTVLGFTGTIMMLVGLYLIALAAWTFKRGALAALGAATVIVGLVALCLPTTRNWLLGTTAKPNSGWVVTTVLPWLRGSWFGLLAVLGALLVLSAGWAFALRIIHGRSQKTSVPT